MSVRWIVFILARTRRSSRQPRSSTFHPDECIDCGACVPACPVEAIFANDEVPDKWTNYIDIDAQYYADK